MVVIRHKRRHKEASKIEVIIMPVKKVKGGYKAKSAITKKWFQTVHKTKAGAEAQWRTSKRRSKRKRSTGSRRAKKRRY